jgi:hypothetical protein
MVWNFVQQLNPKHIFHLLTQNTIKAFKSRAQTIFSLLEKTPPPPWFTKFEFEKFFHYQSTLYKYPKKLYMIQFKN